MHELSIASDLFKIVKEKARENNLKKITKISIKVGVASGIDKVFLKHTFVDHIFPESIAQDAELELVEDSLQAQCKSCEKKINTENKFIISCPACGGVDIEITKGKDIYLECIEGDTKNIAD